MNGKAKKRYFLLLVLLIGMSSGFAHAQDIHIEAPPVVLVSVPFTLYVSGVPTGTRCALTLARNGQVLVQQTVTATEKAQCRFTELRLPRAGTVSFQVRLASGRVATGTLRSLPGWLSLLPPLLAVALAIFFRQVVLALLAGIWVGALLVYEWNPFRAFLRVLDHYLIEAYSDPNHVYILAFSLLLGGMIGIISKSGGTQGLVELMSRMARSSRTVQLSTWLMGLLIFFDDYANTLFVGTSTRPLADRFRVSREKLSYLIDTTAAPVANIALISTWIGFEVSLIGDVFAELGIRSDPYITFIASIPYRFYPIMAILFALWIILLHRDFGPMYRAEIRARATGKVLADDATPLSDYESAELLPDPGLPPRWQAAVIPISTAILAIMAGLWFSGYAAVRAAGTGHLGGIALIRTVLAEADSYKSLMWGAAIGCLSAALTSLGYRILNLHKTLDAWLAGMRAMFLVVIILGLAWSIGDVCADVQTANYLIHFLGPHLSPHWIPALTTLVSAGISFAVGSSWATMSIVMPLVLPLIYFRTAQLGPEMQGFFLIATLSSVLAGATFGDHCSPISDTTILSSLFSGADHVDHVRTQIPYAVVTAVVAVLVGDLATAYGLPVWVALPLGGGILAALVWKFGRRVPNYTLDTVMAPGPAIPESAD